MIQEETGGKKKERSWIKWLLIILLGLGLLLGGIYLFFLQPEIITGIPGISNIPGISGISRRFQEPVTGLLIAVDEDYYGEGSDKVRADLILFGKISPEEKQLILIFIPRHTLVDIPDWGEDMIRFSYMAGELPLTMEVVKSLLKEDLDYYALMDFDSFVGIIDVLEGVEILVDRPIYHEELEIDLEPGLQMLSSKDALSYARYKGEEEEEVDRIRRQQRLALAIYDRALQMRTLTRLPQLVMTIIETVKGLETNVDRDAVIKAVNFLMDMEEPYPNPEILPGTEIEDFWIVDDVRLEKIIYGVE